MKWIPVTAIVFILAFRPLVPLMEYVVNYNRIVTEYCINREKPELMCNGKCYLFDALSKTSDGNSADGISQNILKAQEIYLSAEILQITAFYREEFKRKDLISYRQADYCFYFMDPIFHPPLV